MAWTEERIEQLKKLWEAGDTASQIAEKLGDVSRNAVIGKAHRLGLQARPSPVKNSDHAEATDHGHKEKEEATPSVSKNPTVAPVVNEARKELHKKETVKSVKAVEAVAPPTVAEKKTEPAPVIRSIGLVDSSVRFRVNKRLPFHRHHRAALFRPNRHLKLRIKLRFWI